MKCLLVVVLFALSFGCLVESFEAVSQLLSDPNNSRLRERFAKIFFLEQKKCAKQGIPGDGEEYDFIVVGAGPAGSAVANRLSENPDWRVLLIEAGAYETIFHKMPLNARALELTSSNWNYSTVPQKFSAYGMNNNICRFPRGKCVGGSTSINEMIYVRGVRDDYDRWAKNGADGWAFDDVLPYFRKMEDFNVRGVRNSPYHGYDGPLSIEKVPGISDLAPAYMKANSEAGFRFNPDYNGESTFGSAYIQTMTKRGWRHGAGSAYIDPIRHRPNLRVLTFCQVTKVLIERKTAYGVVYYNENIGYRTAIARKEVILSAGVFNSPQILMLSGIGPTENLNAISVPVIKDLPVGQTMYDHVSFYGPTYTLNTPWSTPNVTVPEVYAFLKKQENVLSSLSGISSLTFLKVPSSKQPPSTPDIEFIFEPGSLASDGGRVGRRIINLKDSVFDTVYRPLYKSRISHYSNLIMILHPESTGKMWLATNNPFEQPIINPNYFSRKIDTQIILEGVKESIRISQQPALQKLGAKLHDIPLPGCEGFEFGSDNYWLCAIETITFTQHHQIATCKMGLRSDPTTVVDSKLRVHGIRRLRVADSSVIPSTTSGHTTAPCYMIGEKCADMIKQFWLRS